MKKIGQEGIFIFLTLIVFITNIVSGQTQPSPLPKGTELKAIMSSDDNVIYVGHVFKKQFVENQNIILYERPRLKTNVPDYVTEKKGEFYYFYYEEVAGAGANRIQKSIPVSSLNPIVSGTYFTENGIAYIKGEWNYDDKFNTRNKYTFKGVFQIFNTESKKGLTTDARIATRTQVNTTDDITYCHIETSSYGNKIDQVKQTDNTYLVTIELSEDFSKKNYEFSKIKKFECQMPTIVYEADFSNRTFLKDNQTGKITFRNGDIFIGTINVHTQFDYTIKPIKGEYKYINGDKYIGTFESHAHESIFFYNSKIYILGQGEITFSDGTTVKSSDWLNQYNFTEEQWKQIYVKPLSPTEIRNRANLIDKERKQKLEEERLAKEQVEKVEKQPLVDKYGEYWGALVYKGEYTLGMTKPMVFDILERKRTTYFLNGSLEPINLTYKDCYITSNTGKSETLTFSKDKFFAFMEKVVGKATNQADQIMLREAINTLKQPLMGQDMLKSNFPTFIFTDSKLAQMYY